MKHSLAWCVLVCCLAVPSTWARSDRNLLKNTCDRKWELIFAHDKAGEVTFGSKAELRHLALTGNYVKANVYLPEHILQLPADSINKWGDELCFQSLRSLDSNGTQVNSTNPRLFYMVCTTGHVTERSYTSATISKLALDWYVKDICPDHKPVYSNYLDGSTSHASRIEKLHDAAQRMGLVGAMRDKPYVFPLDNVMLDPETGEVNGQNVNHIGQRYVENYITFQEGSYRWFSHWSTLGQRDNARWSLQGHTAHIHNSDTSAVDWYADVCWRLIYSHDGSGTDLVGTVDELIDYINRGHRVRVRFDDVNREVSNVRVKNKVVSAQLLNEVSRVGGYGFNRYFIQPDTKAKFSIVHTTGKVNGYAFLVGQAGREVIPAVRKTIEWMVDTRPWHPVMETNGPPLEVSMGSLASLRVAAMGGASIRLMIQQDPADGDFFIQANNIQVDYQTETVQVQAMDYVSDKISRIPNEYELLSTIYNIYYIVSSDGSVRMTSWYYGSDQFRFEETLPTATVRWFVNE